jgi:glycosyltransferase involved in cell wall biosynthesis
MRLVGRDVVCISVMDWDHPFQSSRHHLMRELSSRNRVLFVDASANPLDAWRGRSEDRFRRKLEAWQGRDNPRQVANQLWVWTPPPVFPMGQLKPPFLFEPAYRFNQWTLRQGLRRVARRLDLRDPILWISFDVLMSEGAIGALNEQLLVYHCTDEITALPGISPHAGRIERRLLAKADLTFTSSPALYEGKAPYATRCLMVPNGVDFELFNQAVHPETVVPTDIARLPRPIIGFAGNLEERFDAALWAWLAQARPEWSFVAIGPIAASRQAEIDAIRLPNCHFLGLRPRSALPGYLKAFDVATIPFVYSEQTRHIYPLKVNEYLAAGKPVVMTDFAPLADLEGMASAASDRHAFLAALDQALAPSVRESVERIKRAQAHCWEARCQHMEAEIMSVLAKKTKATPIPLGAERIVRRGL